MVAAGALARTLTSNEAIIKTWVIILSVYVHVYVSCLLKASHTRY